MLVRRWMFAAVALEAMLAVQTLVVAQSQPSDSNTQAPPTAPKPEWTDIPVGPATEAPAAPSAPPLPAIKLPNFSSCSIAEIQLYVPELAHLKESADQSQLPELLNKVGAKTAEIARRTPNLISNEAVASGEKRITTHENYSFLILQHAMGTNSRVFDEYRVDVATGEKLQTDAIAKAAESEARASPSTLLDIPSASPIVPASTGPGSQGFVSAWLYFYPTNRRQSDFRYLGRQKIDSRQTLVVAFAQKPALVSLPTMVDYEKKTYRVLVQGVAWIEPTDFRIVRLRTELLSVPAELPLRQLTAEIHFAAISVADVATPLWLPTQVLVTTNLSGSTWHERHTYTNYRLFRTRSRMVLK